MVMEGLVKMPQAGSANRGLEEHERDFDSLLRYQHQNRMAVDLERELNLYRSGSAPPTVEGARTAVGSLFGLPESFRPDIHDVGEGLSEEEMRSHPAYLSYYYSNENLNPRLPPPMVSKEDWRAAQRFHGLGGIGDRRKKETWGEDESSSSLFALQPRFSGSGGERVLTRPAPRSLSQQRGADLLGQADGLIGLPDVGSGGRRKSYADVIQEEVGHSTSISGHLSHPVSRNSFGKVANVMGVSDPQGGQLYNETINDLCTRTPSPSLSRVKSLGSSISHSFASAVRSPVRSTTPDHQLIGRSPSPLQPTLVSSNGLGDVSAHMVDDSEMISALSGLNLSKNITSDGGDHVQSWHHKELSDQSELPSNMSRDNNLYFRQKNIDQSEGQLYSNDILTDLDLSNLTSNGQVNLQKKSSSNSLLKKVDTVGVESTNSPEYSQYQAAEMQHNQALTAMLNSQLEAAVEPGVIADVQYINRTGDQLCSGFQVPVADPLYAQFAQGLTDFVAQPAARLDPSIGRDLLRSPHMDLSGYQKSHLEVLLAQQRLQYSVPFLGKSPGVNQGFYGSPAFGLGMTYPGGPLSSSVLSSLSSGNHLRQSELLSCFPSMMRSATGGSKGSWNLENSLMGEGFASSLLDEFKNNKTRSFELSEIVDHVVEFSMDQFGSRFIQQKLETASVEEKNMIFLEILPQARSLMTDVFGNYVIQKFFEHGTEIQRKQLADQLIGHVLPLSLQMYGCRVIQKALEVVDIEQQTKMVLELEGSIMKCVRDQNGNHVIQKCIECVPQEKIQFIIKTFYGQVVALSTHPYGCRVIQRVLEHCHDPETQNTMMEEILKSVCTLAQDQYGNYVVQHVLQHGKPEERSAIISKLGGQIVKMSQQKFASNVIEKCLTYGSPEERQLLINEMLGSTDENEPLQAMMKDQFANYVVQTVLETCDDYNRELILSRIKVHLNALKKYTYGKHIVARVEKLIATGESRIGITSHSS